MVAEMAINTKLDILISQQEYDQLSELLDVFSRKPESNDYDYLFEFAGKPVPLKYLECPQFYMCDYERNMTAAELAIMHNDARALRMIIEAGVRVNTPVNIAYHTALRIAVYKACEMVREGLIDTGCINLLLKNGAEINRQDEMGWTPLMEAAREQCLPIYEYLRQHGAEQVANNNGCTPEEMLGRSCG